MDLQLNTDGDLAFVGGELQTVEGRDEVAQRLSIAVGVDRGEWLLDTTFGAPWTKLIVGKGAALSTIEAELKAIILEVEGVDRLTSFEMELGAGRRLQVEFSALLEAEGELEGQLDLDPEGSVGGLIVSVM